MFATRTIGAMALGSISIFQLADAPVSVAQRAAVYYYCPSRNAYWPYVRRCDVPWYIQRPGSPPPSSSMNGLRPASPEAAESLARGRQEYDEIMRQRQEDEERAAAEQKQRETQAQAAKEKTDVDAKAAMEREADQYRRAVARAKARGYEPLSVKDIVLDGKALAERAAKVQVAGFYRKFDENVVALYASMEDAYSNSEMKVPLIMDDAQRELREHLMDDMMCKTTLGCKVTVGGHMADCVHLWSELANAPPVPCLHVESRIVYRPGD